jgi:hypothetical protein
MSEVETENLPVNIDEQFKAMAEAVRKSVASGNFISVSGKQFRLPDESTNDELLGVIVAFNDRHERYESVYQKGVPNAPVCFAIGDGNNMVPHEDSPEPQSENCDLCPLFQWNSGPEGRGKACKTQKILALLAPDNPTGQILLLRVAPKGLTRWDTYLKGIASSVGHPIRVLTKVGFTSDAYPSLTFAVERELQDAEWKGLWPRIQEATEMLSRAPRYNSAAKPEASDGPKAEKRKK